MLFFKIKQPSFPQHCPRGMAHPKKLHRLLRGASETACVLAGNSWSADSALGLENNEDTQETAPEAKGAASKESTGASAPRAGHGGGGQRRPARNH